MTRQSELLLLDLLRASPPDLNRIISTFVTEYNTTHFSPQNDRWDIVTGEWQRYEFLGDRVLNLVVADYLFHHASREREGEMTKRMGAVSNEMLTGIIERKGIDISRLIPETIGQQKTYGERVKGGALEAFFGSLYEVVGFEETRTFILTFLSDEIDRYNPATNFIGSLQEWYQQHGLPVPEYTEIPEKRGGLPHSPQFTYRVYTEDGSFLGEGTGRNATEAKQAAARKALEKVRTHP
jgi:ribonuclease-3